MIDELFWTISVESSVLIGAGIALLRRGEVDWRIVLFSCCVASMVVAAGILFGRG